MDRHFVAGDMLSSGGHGAGHEINAPPPKLKKDRKKLEAAKAMEDACVRICAGICVGICVGIDISFIVVVALIGSSWPAPLSAPPAIFAVLEAHCEDEGTDWCVGVGPLLQHA